MFTLFDVPNDVLASQEVVDAAKKGLEYSITHNDRYDDGPYIEDAKKLSQFISLPESEVAVVVKEGLKKIFEFGVCEYVDVLLDIIEFAKLGLADLLPLVPEKKREAIGEIDKLVPGFAAQCEKSADLLISIVFSPDLEKAIEQVRQEPFFVEAVKNNPRYAPKLVVRYQSFDSIAQEKIKTASAAKTEILSGDQAPDPQSVEFRNAMQERLMAYGRNKEIVHEIEDAGIDTKQWLRYEETAYFKLDSGEALTPLSERMSQPLTRVKETVDQYEHTVKTVLSEYRVDLLYITTDTAKTAEARAQKAGMEKLLAEAEATGEEKKAAGIHRGLENVEKQIETAKPVPLWNRVTDDLSGITKMREMLTASQEAVAAAEAKFDELRSAKNPSGSELVKMKGKLAEMKKAFLGNLGSFERRVAAFRENLPKLLAPLGVDRATSLCQEIEERVAEAMDHFNSDRTTLANIFAERAGGEREKMADRPMSIYVWSRNPDVDLYLGNYTSCCISIEGPIHGGTSPIADYLTDLGIQVVKVEDEATHEPVVAAWCWIGEDKNGEAALVIDNIEANTKYSTNFPEQLSKELFDYLKKYAQAIGAKKLVMGKSYNDLPQATEFAKLPEAGTSYAKLGGANIRDEYYIEAEDETVKLVWESGGEIREGKVKKEAREQSRPKIELVNTNYSGYADKDAPTIIAIERRAYPPDLVRGKEMIDEALERNGSDYSVIVHTTEKVEAGKKKNKEIVAGYALAYDENNDNGEPCVYLEDIAVDPRYQGHGLGWKLVEQLVTRVRVKAQAKNEPIILSMHLRPDSQRLFERHAQDLVALRAEPVKTALEPDYYDEGEDALYQELAVMP